MEKDAYSFNIHLGEEVKWCVSRLIIVLFDVVVWRKLDSLYGVETRRHNQLIDTSIEVDWLFAPRRFARVFTMPGVCTGSNCLLKRNAILRAMAS